jgi:hypothetical protein
MSKQWRTPEQLEARRKARKRRTERRAWQQQLGRSVSADEYAMWLNKTRFRPWETE